MNAQHFIGKYERNKNNHLKSLFSSGLATNYFCQRCPGVVCLPWSVVHWLRLFMLSFIRYSCI